MIHPGSSIDYFKHFMVKQYTQQYFHGKGSVYIDCDIGAPLMYPSLSLYKMDSEQ